MAVEGDNGVVTGVLIAGPDSGLTDFPVGEEFIIGVSVPVLNAGEGVSAQGSTSVFLRFGATLGLALGLRVVRGTKVRARPRLLVCVRQGVARLLFAEVGSFKSKTIDSVADNRAIVMTATVREACGYRC